MNMKKFYLFLLLLSSVIIFGIYLCLKEYGKFLPIAKGIHMDSLHEGAPVSSDKILKNSKSKEGDDALPSTATVRCLFADTFQILATFPDINILVLDVRMYVPLTVDNDTDINRILNNSTLISVGIMGNRVNACSTIINAMQDALPKSTYDIIVASSKKPVINGLSELLNNTLDLTTETQCSHILVHNRLKELTMDIVIVYEKDRMWYTGAIDKCYCAQCEDIGAFASPFAKARLFPKMDMVSRTILHNMTVWIPHPQRNSYEADFKVSEFIPCNYSRTASFMQMNPYNITPEQKLFQVRSIVI